MQSRATEFVEQRPEALSRVLALPPEISEHDRYWVATASASPLSLCWQGHSTPGAGGGRAVCIPCAARRAGQTAAVCTPRALNTDQRALCVINIMCVCVCVRARGGAAQRAAALTRSTTHAGICQQMRAASMKASRRVIACTLGEQVHGGLKPHVRQCARNHKHLS